MQNRPYLVIAFKLLVVVIFALAITVPFVDQPFSFDGPLVLDFASTQIGHPLKQAIDNFDYFGFHYDRFFNTHPRFLSFYLGFVIKAVGEAREVPIHLALTIFPVIGSIGMFFLGRRFRVSGVAASLLFLSGAAFMVGSHIEMVDVPGTCLWVAALAAFIYGVDRNRLWLLALSGVLFLLTIFTFYQGLTALGLGLIYVILKKRYSIRTLAPVLAPALVFLVFLGWFHSVFDQFPRFSYRRQIPDYDKTVHGQGRSVVTILGGTVLFPLVMLFGFMRRWHAALFAAVAAAATWPYMYIHYLDGTYHASDALAFSVIFVAGLTVCYQVVHFSISGVAAWIRKRNNDVLFLCAWFLAVFIYCVIFLGYPAPRYFVPAAAPVVLMLLVLWRETFVRWHSVRYLIAAIAIGLTLSTSVMISEAYRDYAADAPRTAEWAKENYGDHPGTVWFSGELGFSWYMRQQGFKMVPNVCGTIYSETSEPWPTENPIPGDVMIFSSLYGGWLPFPEVMQRSRPAHLRFTWSDDPIILITPFERFWSISTLLLPYSFTDGHTPLDEVYAFDFVEEPVPLPPDLQEAIDECLPSPPSEQN